VFARTCPFESGLGHHELSHQIEHAIGNQTGFATSVPFDAEAAAVPGAHASVMIRVDRDLCRMAERAAGVAPQPDQAESVPLFCPDVCPSCRRAHVVGAA